MKKYLMRGSDLLKMCFDPSKVLSDKMLGSNSGNLIYLNGIYKTIASENVQIDMDNYSVHRAWYSDKDIDYINNTYDAYLCPMADAFRKDYEKVLVRYIEFIRKLKIPFYVIGAGLRGDYEPDIKRGYPFDETVRTFTRLVLEHSGKLGLRGVITGDYLKHLGFVEEKDYTVIGCPSVYTSGEALVEDIPLRASLTPESRINVNFNFRLDQAIGDFIYDHILKIYPNSVYTGQLAKELSVLYLGYPFEGGSSYVPNSIHHDLYQQKRVRFFTNADAWIRDLSSFDLSIGGRLHGNVAAVLAGCPTIFFPADSRMREIIDYHHFYQIKPDTDYKTLSLERLVEGYDGSAMKACHKKNFRHYIDFLDELQIEHNYRNGDPCHTVDFCQFNDYGPEAGMVSTIVGQDLDEVLARSQRYSLDVIDFYRNYVWKRQDRLKVDVASLSKEKDKITKQLNRKSIRFVRRLADFLHGANQSCS